MLTGATASVVKKINWRILFLSFPLLLDLGIDALSTSTSTSTSNSRLFASTVASSTTISVRKPPEASDDILSFISSDEIFPQKIDEYPSFILKQLKPDANANANANTNTANANTANANTNTRANTRANLNSNIRASLMSASVNTNTNSVSSRSLRQQRLNQDPIQKLKSLLQTYDTLLLIKGPLHLRTIQILKDLINSYDLDTQYKYSKQQYTIAKDTLEDILKRKKEMPHTNKSMKELVQHDLIIFQTLAFLYIELGMYIEAKEMYKDVIHEIQCVTLGPNHTDSLRTLQDVANICSILEDYDTARRYYLTCYVQRKKTLGLLHEDTITTLQDLSNLYLVNGKRHQATLIGEKCFNAIVSSGVTTMTIQPKTVFTTLHNLALSYQQDGQYDKAQRLYERCLAQQIRTSSGGWTDEDTLLTMHNLATFYHDVKDYERGIRTSQECFVLRKVVLGLEHHDTLHTLSNLGMLYKCQGSYDKARKVYESCLDLQIATFGDEHEVTLLTRNILKQLN